MEMTNADNPKISSTSPGPTNPVTGSLKNSNNSSSSSSSNSNNNIKGTISENQPRPIPAPTLLTLSPPPPPHPHSSPIPEDFAPTPTFSVPLPHSLATATVILSSSSSSSSTRMTSPPLPVLLAATREKTERDSSSVPILNAQQQQSLSPSHSLVETSIPPSEPEALAASFSAMLPNPVLRTTLTTKRVEDLTSLTYAGDEVLTPSPPLIFPATALSTQGVKAAVASFRREAEPGSRGEDDLFPSSTTPTLTTTTTITSFVEAHARHSSWAEEDEGGGERGREVRQLPQQPVASSSLIEASFSSLSGGGDDRPTTTTRSTTVARRRNEIDGFLPTVNVALSTSSPTSAATDAATESTTARGVVVLVSEDGIARDVGDEGTTFLSTPHPHPPLLSDSAVPGSSSTTRPTTSTSPLQQPAATVQPNVTTTSITAVAASSYGGTIEVGRRLNEESSRAVDDFLTIFAVSESETANAAASVASAASLEQNDDDDGGSGSVVSTSSVETLKLATDSVAVTNQPSFSDMAANVSTSSTTPVVNVNNDTTVGGDASRVPPSPSPTQQAITTTSPSNLTTTSNPTTSSDNNNGSFPLDSVTTTTRSSDSGGGDSAFNLSSSATTVSSSPGYENTSQSLPGSSSDESTVAEGSGNSPGDLPGAGRTSETERDLASTTVLILPCNESSTLSSASGAGNCSAVGNGAGEGSDVPVLLVALPVGVLLLLIFVLAMSFFCFRRKKKKRVHKSSQEDLWLASPSSPCQVPTIALTLSPSLVCNATTAAATTSSSSLPALSSSSSPYPGAILIPPPLSVAGVVVELDEINKDEVASNKDVSSNNEEVSLNIEEADLYRAVHEFPSQQESQLPLTPGDVIVVRERAENGWWRGNVKGDDRCGWFPSGFVVPADQDASQSATTLLGGGEGERGEEEQGGLDPQTSKPRVSSFLVRKKQGTNICLREHNSFSLGKISTQMTATTGVARSASALIPVPPVRLSTSPSSVRPDDFSTSVKDKYFKALFAYKAAYRGELTLKEGEIIQAREKDQNGWMLGRKLHSKEEGWVPAVYVDEMTGDVSLVEKSKGEGERQGTVDHEVYGVLAANRTKSPDQSWIGIEHRVSHPYRARDGSDTLMLLHVGDTVTVVEALDCGWWLGYHGDQVGWFPGDHVELLEEKQESDLDAIPIPLQSSPHYTHITTNNHHNNNHLDVSPASKRSSVASSVDSRELGQDRRSTHTLSRESVLSSETGGGETRPRPARKAPAPPSLLDVKHLHQQDGPGKSTLSRNPRPKRPAPAPPAHKPRCQSMGSVDRVGKLGIPGDGKGTNSGTATPPRRQRKPKVVRVPKEKVGLDKISSCPVPNFPPPPAVVSSPSISSSADESHTTTVSLASVSSSVDECHTVDSQSVSSSAKDSDGVGEVGEQKESSETASAQSDSKNVSPAEGVTVTSPSLSAVSSGVTSEDSGGSDPGESDTDDNQSESGDSSQDTLGPENGATTGDVSPAAVADSSLSAEIFQALSGEMTLSIPGVTSVGENDSESVKLGSPRQPSPVPSLNSTPVSSSPAVVEDSPTLQVPSLVTSTDSCDDSAEAVPTNTEPPPPGQFLGTFLEPEKDSDVVEKRVCDSGVEDSKRPNSDTQSENRHSSGSLLESFQSPLMVDVRASSPIPTFRYLPAPSILLEDAEESSVDDFQPSGQSSPASSETSSRSSSSSKPTTGGYWKFHSGGSNGHSPRPRSTKLTKVAPPVVPKTVKDCGEEGVVEVPPAGTSGRVHKIVHQINRMTSLDEQDCNLPRRPSLNQPPPAPYGELSVEEHSQPKPQQTKDVPQFSEDVKSTTHHHHHPPSTQDSDRETECAKPTEPFANGKVLESSCSENVTNSNSHDSELHSEQGQHENVGLHGTTIDVPDRRSRSRSREGTPESEGEGESRRQSSKKTRAPPPPKSPPFSALRKIHGMSVSEQESTEC